MNKFCSNNCYPSHRIYVDHISSPTTELIMIGCYPSHCTNVDHILSPTTELMMISCYPIHHTDIDHFISSHRVDDDQLLPQSA